MTDDQRPMSVAELRAYADRLEREGRAQLARAKQVRDAADTIERLREMGPLTSDNGYVTDQSMPSIAIVTKHPGPVANKGPASRVATELGFASLSDFAEALGEPYPTVRAWNLKGRDIPARVHGAIDRLRAARKSQKK